MSFTKRATVVAVAASILAVPATAQASTGQRTPAPTTRCAAVASGTLRDVVVPSGANCWIKSALVTGNISVGQGARLSITNTQVRGTTTLSGEGPFLAVRDSELGAIETSGVYGGKVFLEQANVGGTSLTSAEIAAREVTFRGDLTVDTGSALLDDIAVQGELTRTDAQMGAGRFVLRKGKIRGSADLQGSGIAVCGSTFRRHVDVDGNTPIFGVNGRGCGGNTVRGNLSYTASFSYKYSQRAAVCANAVYGRASGTSTVPDAFAVVGSKNVFKRRATGIFATLKRGTSPDIAPLDLSAEQRRAQAVRDAASAR